ncbi:MAG: polyprenyl synthetase family protein [Mogibacterium sp.]|nr:polyprenyl synthetase family protein [Mogibacterium sp.]
MRTYDEYRSLVEAKLTSFLPQVAEEAATVYDAMKYSLTAGGKRLRPVLLLAACDFAGGDINEALPYACALEFIHTYSLIHDDLPAMDDDDLRRGKPTNHVVFGEAMAVLAGDGLLNSACEVITQTYAKCFDDPERLVRHIRAGNAIILAAGVNGMIAGQVADIENEAPEEGTDIAQMVDFIEANKTGALLMAPFTAGLHIAGAPDDMIRTFEFYARCIGKGFQIADDILDFTSTPEELGKSIGKDKEQGKCNYVMVYGMDRARQELSALTQQALDAMAPYGDSAAFFIDIARRLETRKA